MIRVEVPDDATPEQIIAYVQQNYSPKPKLSQEEKLARARVELADTSATNDMSGLDKFRAGVGKSFYDIGRGVSQLVGARSRGEQDESNQIDQALMDSGAGTAGNIVGHMALAAPTAVIPGAATVRGGALIGAGTGFIQPVGTQDSRATNTLTGGVFGAALPAAVTAYKGGRALMDPLTEAGRERIVARTIERFADNPNAVRNAAGELVAGSKPTLAEATLDPGIATLQRSAVAADPKLASAMSNRALDQNAARVAALRQIGGDAGELDFNYAARKAFAEELYQKAFAETPGNTKWIKGEITKLVHRPAFVEALKEAQTIAMNQGVKISPKNPENATQVLHFTKMALDDMIAKSEGNAQKGYLATRDKVVSLMESKDFSPSYREARDTYAKMSGPINRMEIGKEIERRVFGGLDDPRGNPTLTPAKYANTIKDEAGITNRATGRPRTFKDALRPEDQATLEALRQDLSRADSVAKLGKPTGSPTAQYLSSQNLMRQMAGPVGMPQSWSESALLKTAMRPVDFAYSRAEPMVQESLAKALLDPNEAQRILAQALTQQPELLNVLARYLTVSGGPAGLIGRESAQK